MSSKIPRKLAAIMFTDIVGYTKIIGDDESTGISILENQESLISPLVLKHDGKIINTTGDGYLIEFSSSVESVECAIEMQEEIKKYNENKDNLEFHIRIGIHLGDIAIVGDNILGEGVNIASRIEPMASPDGICITEAVYQSVKSKLNISPKRVSDVDLKNIDDKYTLYKIPDISDSDASDNTINQIQDSFNIGIQNVVKESISFSRFIKLFFSFFLFCFLFGVTGGGLLRLGAFFFPELSYYFLFGEDPSRPYLDSFINPSTKELLINIFSLTILFNLVYSIIKRSFMITFKDIRDVNYISNILIRQMGYKYVGNEGGQAKYFYPLENKSLYVRIFTLSFIPYIYKQSNTLLLKFDGNTITLQCRNSTLKRFVKRLENLS